MNIDLEFYYYYGKLRTINQFNSLIKIKKKYKKYITI